MNQQASLLSGMGVKQCQFTLKFFTAPIKIYLFGDLLNTVYQ